MKKCTICKKPKILSDFNVNRSKKDGLQPHCRECGKIHSKLYYKRNPHKHRKNVAERRKRLKAEIQKNIFEYLLTHSCVECPEANPILLEFDHVRGKKKKAISEMVHHGDSWKKVQEEIAKCEVRCVKCHRLKTAKDFNWYTYQMMNKRDDLPIGKAT